MFYEPQALIVVYKDELLANQLKNSLKQKTILMRKKQ